MKMYSYESTRICPYEHYYTHQAGSGIGVIYKGAPFQRGHGIGAFLGGLFRSVLPLLSSGAKAIGREALNAGTGFLSDMISGRAVEDSVRNRFKEVTSNLKRKADTKIDNIMTGSGYKTKRHRLQSITSKKYSKKKGDSKINKNNSTDIFSK